MPGANGASDGAGQRHSWRTWQSDDDIPQRKILIQHMCVERGATRRGARAMGRASADLADERLRSRGDASARARREED